MEAAGSGGRAAVRGGRGAGAAGVLSARWVRSRAEVAGCPPQQPPPEGAGARAHGWGGEGKGRERGSCAGRGMRQRGRSHTYTADGAAGRVAGPSVREAHGAGHRQMHTPPGETGRPLRCPGGEGRAPARRARTAPMGGALGGCRGPRDAASSRSSFNKQSAVPRQLTEAAAGRDAPSVDVVPAKKELLLCDATARSLSQVSIQHCE